MYVYAEYLLLENMIINFIILYVTKRITRTKTTKLRLFIAASIGSIYTLVAFFPSLQFMVKFSIKISISVLMIILAFNPERLNLFFKQISTFYMISFAFAGAIIGIFYILNNNLDLTKFSFRNPNELIRFLTMGILISIFLIQYVLKFYQSRMKRENHIAYVTICLNNKEVELATLIDTGNSLREPISQMPVIIAEYGALESILAQLIKEMYLNKRDLDLEFMIEIMEEIGDDIRLRLIPFKSLGNENGMLVGFKPDRIKVYLDKEIKNLTDDIIVAIYNDKLVTDEQYNGLLHPEILG